MATPEKRRGLSLDGDLQHVRSKATDKPHHQRFRCRHRRLASAQQAFDFFLQSDARGTLFMALISSPLRYQRSSRLTHEEDTNASLLLQEV
jgi:hypothetical protein